MAYTSIVAIAVALAMDAVAVSLAIGVSERDLTRAQAARASLTFGVFQGGMPVLGWFLGGAIVHLISRFDHWVAFVILAAIGVRMIVSGLRGRPTFTSNPTSGMILLGLALATSIDALAVGFSFAMMSVSIWMAAIIIAIVTSVLSAIAMALGRRAGVRWSRWAEIAGGIILCAIGLRIMLEHTAGAF
jgi:putative Mn2+ efflux pump MntP